MLSPARSVGHFVHWKGPDGKSWVMIELSMGQQGRKDTNGWIDG